jgi:uncharacterized protein YyaL (SSP411 family)
VPNRLAAEASPYLLQHKDNPVDWYAWGADAFERARREDKPIFLSIGYSTCHWCHVMEHESFENPSVADVLNTHFVSIKVDREERPDVDRVYMTFVQATTGSGGWPMSVWLTPSLHPFYGGTYFPPSSKWGRPGFAEILQEIARVWREERGKVESSAESVVDRLRTYGSSDGARRSIPAAAALDEGVRQFAAGFDERRGGFGDAPKFPRPSELLFLLREYARTGSRNPLDMVLLTLRAMALGGMRDHIGGGFHRYSVDGNWRVPHFEKMLYDQAQLVLAYLEAAQASGDQFYGDVAADTLAYVARDLTDEHGGFYSAEDADSVPPEIAHDPRAHKMEGAFYIWRDDEIREVLGDDAEVFRIRFGILPDGNAPFDPQDEFAGKNLLYTARSLDEIVSATAKPREAIEAALARARVTLLERRSARPRPHLDDKILTAWNGLMIAAFARASRVLGADLKVGPYGCHDMARRAALFIWKNLWNAETQTLLRRYRKGDAAVEGYAEDYAYLIFGLLELFQADGDARWLEWALMLQRRQDELFADPVEGGWFSTTGRDPSVLLRMKEDYDGAEPAATSVSVFNLLTLSHLTNDDAFEKSLERAFGLFAPRIEQGARTVPMMMAALSTYHAGVSQVVVAGEASADGTRALMNVLRSRYLPFAVLVPLTGIGDRGSGIRKLLPWTESMMRDTPTAYVCRDFTCQAPVTAPDALRAQLEAET